MEATWLSLDVDSRRSRRSEMESSVQLARQRRLPARLRTDSRLEEASWEDIVAILNVLAVPSAFVVGKDFSAMTAYDFVSRHPERTCGVPWHPL
ncbi:hypothetical protein ABZP36_032911 [Zizania latifolia]